MERVEQLIVLFDGDCNLCNASVNFIIDRDPRGVFRFTSLQSPYGRRVLEQFGWPAYELSSVVLVEGDRIYAHSSAALRIASRLSRWWKLLYILMLVPRPLRDVVYNWVARNRHRWFGKAHACRIPTPEIRRRFMDQDAQMGDDQ